MTAIGYYTVKGVSPRKWQPAHWTPNRALRSVRDISQEIAPTGTRRSPTPKNARKYPSRDSFTGCKAG
ncbi:MAG: hypothetical protein HQL94_06380 [Magnetococcales bacterium]|nr:hypothetical protein [Magnetococcales bacterium]